MTSVLLRALQEETDTYAGRPLWQVWRDAAMSLEASRNRDRVLEHSLPQGLQRSGPLLTSSYLTSGLQNGRRVNLCCVKLSVGGALLQRPGKLILSSRKKCQESRRSSRCCHLILQLGQVTTTTSGSCRQRLRGEDQGKPEKARC